MPRRVPLLNRTTFSTPDDVRKRRRERYQRNKESEMKSNREYFRKLRRDLLLLLGTRCMTCGYSDARALQIDHIHGSGTQEYIQFRGSTSYYLYYLNHPDEAKSKLQILCANCNLIKIYEKKEWKTGDRLPKSPTTSDGRIRRRY